MKFSIIVPAYKPNFLKECIDSILTQTYTDFELIIVNDASPYDLDTIVNSYQDNRIRYYKNEKNYGAVEMVKNWNHCLEYATGDYVINMGDDDMLTPCCLEDYDKMIKKFPELNIFHTRMAFIDENTEIINLTPERAEFESAYSAIWHFFHGRVNRIGDWLFKTKVLKEKGGFYYLPCAWASDDITAFMMVADGGVANSTYIGFLYRTSSLTVSKGDAYSFEKIQAHCKAREWYYQFLQEIPKDEKDQLYRRLLLSELDSTILRFKQREIRNTLSKNISLSFKWFKRCSEYGVSKRFILDVVKTVLYRKLRTKLS